MANTPTDDLPNATAPADLTTKLDHLKAAATQQYSLKNYTAAAESFSEAAELQDQLNGEMSPENVDLLYQYGRCLYHVAISNSDVLGGKVASTEEPKRKKRKVGKSESNVDALGGGEVIGDALKDGEQKLAAEEVIAVAEEEKDGMLVDEPVAATAKPFFQITGDENWTDSEEDEDAAHAEGEADAEEEEDDFAIAYEILDTARILLSRKLEATQQTAGKGTTSSPEMRQLKERLADTHDLQAEISLENERFQDAIQDTRDALALKLDLYPQESSLIAEAHFKLSLALEFASVTSTADAGGDAEARGDSVAQVDEGLRKESAGEMEKAIASCQLRISKEEEACTAEPDAAKAEERRKAVAEVKEMVADMEQRLRDLRNPAVSMSGVSGVLTGDGGGGDPLRGVPGAMLGESGVEQRKRVADATEKANDLTGLVKHRKKKERVEEVDGAGIAVGAVSGKGKRKAEEVDGEGSGNGGAINGKKAKVEDVGSA
ncbi:hypothetical protein LTR12_012833 [Friedmanniomyces endolithicus]|nr:hypothetical protein LTR74_017220 [Friedmanniomyces endolithicus]KAK1812806.1 hypothetical protein LTR12_012833 [Friedmanniomyces endolithicus]